MITLGDRSQSFQSLQAGSRLKAELNRFSNELSSGKPDDIAQHLSGQTSALAGLDRDLARIDNFLETSSALGLTLDRQQLALGALTDMLEATAERLVLVNDASNDQQIAAAEAAGLATLTSSVERLNGFANGRALFSGVATDRAPLASAEVILAALEVEVAGLTTADDVATAVKAWFADDLGGFSAVAYQGATNDPATYHLSDFQAVKGTARADEIELRSALAAGATAALSGRLAGSIDREVRKELLQNTGVEAFNAAQGLHALGARVGDDQALIETERVRLGAQRTTFATARNDIATIDTFEAATRLQDVQQSLELHFAATARLSRLSLANYL